MGQLPKILGGAVGGVGGGGHSRQPARWRYGRSGCGAAAAGGLGGALLGECLGGVGGGAILTAIVGAVMGAMKK